jgi:hypothetical protein
LNEAAAPLEGWVGGWGIRRFRANGLGPEVQVSFAPKSKGSSTRACGTTRLNEESDEEPDETDLGLFLSDFMEMELNEDLMLVELHDGVEVAALRVVSRQEPPAADACF